MKSISLQESFPHSFFLFFIFLLLLSCSKDQYEEDSDIPIYNLQSDEFPKSYILEDELMVNKVFEVDSFLVAFYDYVYPKGLGIFNKYTLEKYGEYGERNPSPYLIQTPLFDGEIEYSENGIRIGLSDYNAAIYQWLNINRTVEEGKVALEDRVRLPFARALSNTFYLADSLYIGNPFIEWDTIVETAILIDLKANTYTSFPKKKQPNWYYTLPISAKKEILRSYHALSPNKKYLVASIAYEGEIALYSIGNPIERTVINREGELDWNNELSMEENLSNLIPRHGYPRTFTNFFLVTAYEYPYSNSLDDYTKFIVGFDYEGNALFKIKTYERFNEYYLNEKTGDLYLVYNYKQGQVEKINIKSILEKHIKP